ncbi:hypothetical protein [Xanthomonas campestris]|jgi:hypothetical protein|uniref:hypothetical protein n=1 Tax=Xanthomonas campestris TaxID=339 RepID=UPI002B236C02|nr:hypothetical protein [Xanthomonas campestris]MEA9732553.1 hypothetical protein [Xanthomonas campestris]
MDRDTTFKEHYFWELQRRDALNSSLSFLVGVVTLLLGGTYTMAKASSLECNAWALISAVALSVTAALLFTAVYFIVRAYTGYSYAHSPDADGLMSTKKQLFDYHKGADGDDETAQRLASIDFFQQIDERYAKDASTNGNCNDTKAGWIRRANRFVAWALVGFAASGVAYLVRPSTADREPIKVQVTNLSEVSMSENKPAPPPPPPPQTTNQQSPAKPAIPPSRIIMDGIDPSRRK